MERCEPPKWFTKLCLFCGSMLIAQFKQERALACVTGHGVHDTRTLASLGNVATMSAKLILIRQPRWIDRPWGEKSFSGVFTAHFFPSLVDFHFLSMAGGTAGAPATVVHGRRHSRCQFGCTSRQRSV